MVQASVIIAAFNAEAFVSRAIESALRQDLVDLEVIVVDDCSRDSTVSVVRAHSDHDSRVRLVSLEANCGPGQARNAGIEVARGDWIAILDADDSYHPSRLSVLLDLAERLDASIVADNLELLSLDGRLDGRILFSSQRMSGEEIMLPARFVKGNISIKEGNYPSLGLLKPILRRSEVVKYNLRYPSIRFSEDLIFLCRCLSTMGRFATTDRALYRYTVRSGSATFSATVNDLRDLLRAERQLLGDPEILRDSSFVAALKQHSQSLEKAIQWRGFAEAMKTQEFLAALLMLTTSPKAALHISKELLNVLKRIARRSDSVKDDIW